MRLLARCGELSVPKRSESWNLENDTQMDLGDREVALDVARIAENVPPNSGKCHLINQVELGNLVRDLNMTEKQAQLLGSIFQGCSLLEEGKVLDFHNREKDPASVFSMISDISYCSSVELNEGTWACA
jgi:hypothetical protein